ADTSGSFTSPACAVTEARTLPRSLAYGRAPMTRSCARRSFAAATIFMALVICCVLLTERSRRRMSISEAIVLRGRGLRVVLDEAILDLLDRLAEGFLGRLLQFSRRHDGGEDLPVSALQMLVQALL